MTNSINNHTANRNVDDMDTHILNSYIDFITTSTTSLHSILEIINNQQSSFDQILSYHIPPTITTHIPTSSFYNVRNPYIVNRTAPVANRTAPVANRTAPVANRTAPVANRTAPGFGGTINLPHNIFNLSNNDIEYATRINMQNIMGHIITDLSAAYPSVPSTSQIDAAIERVSFRDIPNPLNHSCPISQVDFSNTDIVIILKECRHIFCPISLLRWFERNVHCPLCRHDIRRQTNISSSPMQSNSPTSNPLPFVQQLAGIMSDHGIISDQTIIRIIDISDNINIELQVPRNDNM